MGARLRRPARAAGLALACQLVAGTARGGESGSAGTAFADGGFLWLLAAVGLPLVVATLYFSRLRGSAVPAHAEAPAGESGGAGDLDEVPPAFAFYEETFRTLVASLEMSQSEQERSYIEVIGAMVATAHARDHETIGHSFRVARYATALAQRMGISGETLTAIEWGALLHDVGKIAVPERVLQKSGPLSDEERKQMELHPRRGYQMLKSLLFLGTALDIVLSHHERWDGRGYPNGLTADEIPLSARIFAVVDSYDAITSDRPYRPARGHREATAELLRVAGSQLDPRVVDHFLEIPREELERLRDLSEPIEASVEALAAIDEERERHRRDDEGDYELRAREG
ncbi:MAG TPA: HD-GYP domain-containing protein [Thermoanaerobaculia bacterium]|nr:HD-GYP domain-containing protein [Thermoanaerobaculia bacterium]